MLESKSVGNLENSIDSGTFSVRNYLSLIWKDAVQLFIYMFLEFM